MGQQQLLLVILVTIIVGIATVVAINTFGAAADSANVDAVRQDVAQIAAASQGYYMKPTMLGGGGRDFSDITFNHFAFPAAVINDDGDQAENENGIYIISAGATGQFTLTAHPASCTGYVAGARTEGVLTSVGTGCPSGDDRLVATIEPDNLIWEQTGGGTSD
jgi:Tfp pilus assembly protein PilE